MLTRSRRTIHFPSVMHYYQTVIAKTAMLTFQTKQKVKRLGYCHAVSAVCLFSTMRFISDKVRSIMEAYWDCTDVKFTADAVFAVAKLSCDFIDKAVSTSVLFST